MIVEAFEELQVTASKQAFQVQYVHNLDTHYLRLPLQNHYQIL